MKLIISTALALTMAMPAMAQTGLDPVYVDPVSQTCRDGSARLIQTVDQEGNPYLVCSTANVGKNSTFPLSGGGGKIDRSARHDVAQAPSEPTPPADPDPDDDDDDDDEVCFTIGPITICL